LSNRQRFARALVAVLLVAQIIGSTVATLKLGWGGLGISLIFVPVLVAVALSWSIPVLIAVAVVGFIGYGLLELVRWIARGPVPTKVDPPPHAVVLQHIEELEHELGIGGAPEPKQVRREHRRRRGR
jgi:hypothetical protein